MENDRQGLTGQGSFNFGDVDMRGLHVRGFIDQGLTGRSCLIRVTITGVADLTLTLRGKAADFI